MPCFLEPGHEGDHVPWVPHDDDWVPDGGPAGSPDHWHYEIDEDITLTVWPRSSGTWIWEVWNTSHTCGGPTDDERRGCPACADPDEPVIEDEVGSFAEAKRAAERAWWDSSD